MNRIYTVFRMFLLMVFLYSAMFGDTLLKEDSTEDILSLVSKVKEAKASERRVLMNQLKISLRKVNQASRQRIMLQLRKNFNRGSGLHPMTMTHSNAQQCQETRNMSMHMQHSKGRNQKRRPKRGK